jgi:hypothetical protein
MISGSIDCSSVIVKDLEKTNSEPTAAQLTSGLTRSLQYYDEYFMSTTWVASGGTGGTIQSYNANVYAVRINNLVILNPVPKGADYHWKLGLTNNSGGRVAAWQTGLPTRFRPTAGTNGYVVISENSTYTANMAVRTDGTIAGPYNINGDAISGGSGTTYIIRGPIIYYTNSV